MVLPDEHQILDLLLADRRQVESAESFETDSITPKFASHATVDLIRDW